MPGTVSSSDNPDTSALATASKHSCWVDTIPRTPHNHFFIRTDYTATSLGPKECWGPALRAYASMVFADTRGAGLFWGPELLAVYNHGLAVCIGAAHPDFMGRGLFEMFPETRSSLEPVLTQARKTGLAADVNDIHLSLERSGFVEETYFVGQYIPLRGDDGDIAGFYNTVFESTTSVVSARRRRVVDLVAAIPPLPVDDTLNAFVQAVQTNPWDVAACMLYSFDETADASTPNLHLCGSIGIPTGHRLAPTEACLGTSSAPLIQAFRKAQSTRKLATLDWSEALMEGIDWCGFGEPSKVVVVCPLITRQSTLGFYVQGVNPRRPFDETMRQSIEDLARQLEAKWASSISKQDLERRQHALEQRASDSEKKLRHLAQSAPVGMVQVGIDCNIQWANDQFYDISGHDRSNPDMAAFRDVLAEDEGQSGVGLLRQLFNGARSEPCELRLRRHWKPPVKEDEDTEATSAWMLVMCFPQMRDGRMQHSLVYVTDISHQKWAEGIQSRNAAAATLAKKRQEEFIDVTCHEMRNPLSAITQLADSIANSTREDQPGDEKGWKIIAEENAASADTIAICAAHQKRVIDDVLMLSRLDAKMLTINPAAEDPANVVSTTIRMFQGETTLNETEIYAEKDSSIDDHAVRFALIDASRLVQVLVNLISNSIKFLTSRTLRKISLRYGAHVAPPESLQTSFGEIDWIEPARGSKPFEALSSYPQNSLYLHFVVQDTGPGIVPDQLKKLFKRFSQASSRSHISYGGSGLGLYICRELVEIQGGRVGVASKPGEGSAFAFYIESRYAPQPEQSPISTPEVPSARNEGTQMQSDSVSTSLPIRDTILPKVLVQGRPAQSPPLVNTAGELNILLVEDNLINQKVLAKQLQREKCNVTVANHGQEALDILETADCWQGTESVEPSVKVDVILMDVEMPVMNGLQCARRIRRLEKEGVMKHLPIIAITSNARQEQQEMALDAGMTGVITKPVTVREVLKKIRELRAGEVPAPP